MGVGALMAGREDYESFYQVGLKVGRAFQLIDDALDYVGSEEKLGKPVGNDLKEGKCTYPLISVLESLDKEEVKRAIVLGDVENLRKRVVELGGVEKTKERAWREIEEAVRDLERLVGDGAVALKELILSAVKREK